MHTLRMLHSKALLLLVVLLISLGATYLSWSNAKAEIAKDRRADFNVGVQRYADGVNQRFTLYSQILLGVRAMLSESGRVDHQRLSQYLSELQRHNMYSGVFAINLSVIVPQANKEAFERDMRRQGHAGFRIWPDSSDEFLAPLHIVGGTELQRSRVLGYDPYSDGVRRAAMEKARDADAVALSGKVKLVGNGEQEAPPGLMMYLPIYRHGAAHGSTEERRASIIGWVCAAFHIQDFLSHANGERHPALQVRILDASAASPGVLLHDSGASTVTANDQEQDFLEARQLLKLGDRQWEIDFRQHPSTIRAWHSFSPEWIAVAGTAVSLLLTAVFYLLALGEKRASALAAAMARKLRDREAFLNFALDGVGDGVWEWNLQTDEAKFSDRWKSMLGHAADEVGSHLREWQSRVHPDDLSRTLADIKRYLSGEAPSFVNEHRMLCKDGSWKWILDRGIITSRSARGEPLRMVGTHVDITARKEMEEQLALFGLVFENLGEAITITEADGTIVAVNPAFTRITGYPLSEAIGQNPRILKSGMHDSAFYEAMWQSILATGCWRGEIWNRRKDGSLVPEMLKINSIYNPDGSVRRYVAMFHDITDIKDAEKTIRDMNANRTIEREKIEQGIAREIHDDLGQRLSLHRLDVLSLDRLVDKSSPEIADMLDRMRLSVEECIGMVRNIVSNLRPPVLDIGVVAALKWLVENFEKRTGIMCLCNCDSCAETAFSEHQSLNIFRIVQESLSNVLQHAHAECVTIELACMPGRFALTITDDGVGIPQDARKFVDSYGLIGIRERVAMLGGSLNIRSAPGAGTTLEVVAPTQPLDMTSTHD